MRPFVAAVCAGLFLAVGFNYAVDPNYQWHRGALRLSENWRADQMLVFPGNLSDRLVRSEHLRVVEEPDVLLLGSSRMMPVDSTYFAPGFKVYNAGMVGSSMEDYASMWQEFKEQGKIPRRVVIFADPWILNRNSRLIRWRDNLELYMRFQRDAGLMHPLQAGVFTLWQSMRHGYTLACELLSWGVLAESARLWTLGAARADAELHVVPLEDYERDTRVQAFRRDGSMILHDLRPPNAARLRDDIEKFAEVQDSLSLGRYEMDPSALATLSALLREMTERGSSAVLILLPFHPLVLKQLTHRPAYRAVLPGFVSTLGKLSNGGKRFILCDALSAASSCAETEFLDALHPMPVCLRRIVSRCLASDERLRALSSPITH